MIVAALMVLMLGLVILLLRRVTQADRSGGATTDLGFFSYKEEKEASKMGKSNA